MNENKLQLLLTPASRSNRLFALLIDDVIILVPTVSYLYFNNIDYNNAFSTIIKMEVFTITFFLLKDVFGRSPGKAIVGLRIVRQDDYSKRANPFVTILRNFMGYFFFGVEALVILFNKKGQRMADMVTRTIVVTTHSSHEDLSVAELVGEVTDDLSEPTVCVVCHTPIPSTQSRCSKCGWSYKE